MANTPIESMVQHESLIRLGSFLSIFIAMALWESVRPGRPRSLHRAKRWLSPRRHWCSGVMEHLFMSLIRIVALEK